MKTEQIDKALRIACSKDALRPWMCHPFSKGGWNIATDAHVILAFKGAAIYEQLESPSSEKAVHWIENGDKAERSGSITATQLSESIAAWPLENDPVQFDCPKCKGSGSVLCECRGCGDEHDKDCSECQGRGKIESSEPARKVPTSMGRVSVGGFAKFGNATWPALAAITKILGVSEWHITHGTERTGLRLVSGDFVAIIMPVMSAYGIDEPPFYVIP